VVSLKSFTSFLLILVGLLLAMRAVHVVAPMVYAPGDPRPLHTTDLQLATERAGFEPWLPFYVPQKLGAPPQLTAIRRPRARISIVWDGESKMMIREEPSSPNDVSPPGASPLPGGRGDVWWEGPDFLHAVAMRGDLRIEIATDLAIEDLGRVVATLRPGTTRPPAE